MLRTTASCGSFADELLNGNTTFEEALRSDDSRAIELSQLLYFLLVTDMVKPQVRPGEAPRELAEKPPAPSAETPRAVDYREIASASERIATEYLRLKDADPRSALGVAVDDDLETIERAFVSATSPLEPRHLPPGLGDDMLRKVREIVEMLHRARSLLHEDAKRRGLAPSTVAPVAPPTPDAAPATPPATPAPIEDEDTVPDSSGGNGVDAHAIYSAGQSLLAEGRFKDAQRTIQQALALDPTVARYWVGLSQAFLLDDSTTAETARHGALNCLRRAVQVEPDDVSANWEIGKLLVQLGLSSEAKGHLQRVVARSPDHQDAQKLLSTL
ncbi:MAG: tetratricopeptide repeat protein [Myxococcota bacterium]